MSTTSKQDRQGSRTPADLERKYDLGAMGDRFAEIMGIATDAQTHSEAALDAIGQTNSVVADLSQRVNEISITVKDLDEGTLAALSVEVGKISLSVEELDKDVNSAEFVIGIINKQSTAKISADRLDIVGKKLNIKVDATNIEGKLTADKIEVEDLSALNATIGGWSMSSTSLFRKILGSSHTHDLKLSAEGVESTATSTTNRNYQRVSLYNGRLNITESKSDSTYGYEIAYYSNNELGNSGYIVYINPADGSVKAKLVDDDPADGSIKARLVDGE